MSKLNKYELMCKKAIEIQDIWKPTEGDFTISGVLICGWDGIGIVYSDEDEDGEMCDCVECIDKEDEIWLPHQAQLQGMLSSIYPRPVGLLLFFSDWIADNTMPEDETSTLDELWLMFVMEIKYNKEWNGENWNKKG